MRAHVCSEVCSWKNECVSWYWLVVFLTIWCAGFVKDYTKSFCCDCLIRKMEEKNF